LFNVTRVIEHSGHVVQLALLFIYGCIGLHHVGRQLVEILLFWTSAIRALISAVTLWSTPCFIRQIASIVAELLRSRRRIAYFALARALIVAMASRSSVRKEVSEAKRESPFWYL
jgi:hypothetical protein